MGEWAMKILRAVLIVLCGCFVLEMFQTALTVDSCQRIGVMRYSDIFGRQYIMTCEKQLEPPQTIHRP